MSAGLAGSFYEPDGGADDRWLATSATEGPWSAGLQHGGPPAALLVRASERAAARETGRDDLRALRVAVDFLGAVPVGAVDVRADVVRAGRSAVLVDAELSAATGGGAHRVVLRSRTWLLRRAQDPTPSTSASLPPDVPGPDGLPDDDGWRFGYARHLLWRPAAGNPHVAGPAAVWASPQVPLVPGEPLTGLQRVVTVADSASGVSAEVAWDRWSFANVDLTVHLARPPEGDWLLLDARSRLEPTGNGVAEAVLHDRRGPAGRSAQTLVVTPLP
jgi:acyl-coenzyme A thioesterase PaaI-like protein